jgi:hypothetical protein
MRKEAEAPFLNEKANDRVVILLGYLTTLFNCIAYVASNGWTECTTTCLQLLRKNMKQLSQESRSLESYNTFNSKEWME